MRELILAALLISVSTAASGASLLSKHLKLANDQGVTTNTALIATSITLATPSKVYVQADGRYYPGPPHGKALANAYILVNGILVSNESIIDWRQSSAKKQHSFNVIGIANLPAGTHTVGLYGAAIGSSAIFGKDSALSILVDPVGDVSQARVSSDSSIFNFNTAGVTNGAPLPVGSGQSTVLSLPVFQSGPVIAMASGRSYASGKYGDAMIGIFANHAEQNIDSTTWSINDLYTGAETQAPMYSQAMFTHPGISSVQLVASESPYAGNNVQYRIGAGSSLVVMSGLSAIAGKGLTPSYPYSTSGNYNRFAYKCIATNGFLSTCPSTESEVVIGSGQVCIPPSHNGVVMFSAKTRIQADPADLGGERCTFTSKSMAREWEV